MKKIPLTRGEFAIIDDGDFKKISRYSWYTKISSKTKYACAAVHLPEKWKRENGVVVSRGYKHISMHRLIIGAREREIVDHINRNGLDNRKKNLRICGKKGNARNVGLCKRNKSGYKGVFNTNDGRERCWVAQIHFEGKRIHLGGYSTPKEAAIVYDNAARKYFGEHAYLNHP